MEQPDDDGRRYRFIEALTDLRVGTIVFIARGETWRPWEYGLTLRPMVHGSYGFVQVAGPPEESH